MGHEGLFTVTVNHSFC